MELEDIQKVFTLQPKACTCVVLVRERKGFFFLQNSELPSVTEAL